MRGLKVAKRYAILNVMAAHCGEEAHSSRDKFLSARDFARIASDTRTMRNTKKLKRVVDRMVKRQERFSASAARDARLLIDLGESKKLQDAQATRRQWFTIGKLVARAAADDADWREILQRLIERSPLSAPDANALGLTRI